MKTLLRLVLLVSIVGGAFGIQAQTATPHIFAARNGDLWKYDVDAGSAVRLTRSGYNGGPVLSPDGRQFAFLQTAAGFLAQYRNGAAAQTSGTPPADIWTYDIATSAYRQIADQTGGSSAGYIRSIPAWSPDSRQLAWLQIDTGAQVLGGASLVLYDLEAGRARLIASSLDLGYQAADIVMPRLRWGSGGIARLVFAYPLNSQTPHQFLEIIQPASGERIAFDLGLAADLSNRVGELIWGDHLGREVALLRRDETWEALDPLHGARSTLSAPPRLKHRFIAGLPELMPIAVAEHTRWHALAGGVIYDTGFVSATAAGGGQPAISSDGATLAWHDGADLHLWRVGDAPVFSDASDLAEEPPFPIPGPSSIAWTPMLWSAPAGGAQALDRASPQSATCDLPPQLPAGHAAVVSPGLANRVRSGASLNAAVIGSIAPGEVAQALSGPVCADGYHWYEIQNQRISGWTVEGAAGEYWLLYHVACENSPPIRLGKGMLAEVTPGQANNIRSGPGVAGAAILGKIAAGARFEITGHPVCDAAGLRWFPIQYGETQGWTAAGQSDAYWIAPIANLASG